MVSTVTETWWYDLSPDSGEETLTIISKGDTYIEDNNVNDANGWQTTFNVGQTAPGNIQRALFQIKFPEAPENAGRIVSTSLQLYQEASAYVAIPVGLTIYLCDLEPNYIPGYTSTHAGTGYGATWTAYDGHNAWVAAERNGEAVRAFVTTTDGNDSSYISISLDELVTEENLTWGSTYDVLIRTDDEAAGDTVNFSSMNSVTAAQRPKIQIEYELIQQEIPDSKDEILTIEPNPANPTQPLLKWKTPENFSLRLDSSGGFCLVRNTTIIDAITDGNLIARINQGEEYIDGDIASGTTTATSANHLVDATATFQTDGVGVGDTVLNTTDDTTAKVTAINSQIDLTLDADIMTITENYTVILGENNLYYYKLYFCSENDYISGTTLGAMSGMTIYGTPAPSNQVWMIRPDITSFVFDDYTPDVKQQVTATITAVTTGDYLSTPTPTQHIKYQYDWKGDSTEVGWVELDTPANSHTKTHYYLGYQGATSAKARIENSLGFWSDATNSGSTVTVAAITPIPLINVSPKTMAHDTQVTGTATGTQSASTLKDTSKTWTTNEHTGRTITIHLDGGQLYESRVISSNTTDTITVAPNWTNNPVTTTTQYEVVTAFDGVLRVLADQSYARSSNETITKYEFRVQRTGDSAYYDAAGPPYWVAGVTWNDLLTVPYMDITATNMGAEDTYTCLSRVTSSSFGLSSTTASTTMTVTTDAAVDMKATLTSSNFDTQNLGRRRTMSTHKVVDGTSDTIIDSGISSPSVKVSGHCYGENFQTDYNQLQTWESNKTLLKVYTDPQASTPSKFVEGYIRNLRVTKRLSMNIYWDCDFVVKNATL
jgi:hypothetical protein